MATRRLADHVYERRPGNGHDHRRDDCPRHTAPRRSASGDAPFAALDQPTRSPGTRTAAVPVSISQSCPYVRSANGAPASRTSEDLGARTAETPDRATNGVDRLDRRQSFRLILRYAVRTTSPENPSAHASSSESQDKVDRPARRSFLREGIARRSVPSPASGRRAMGMSYPSAPAPDREMLNAEYPKRALGNEHARWSRPDGCRSDDFCAAFWRTPVQAVTRAHLA